jgi:endo-1,4-beta-mannosidase
VATAATCAFAAVALIGAVPATAQADTAATVSGLREISYYPSQNPWNGMWYQWYPGVIWADMAKIASLGANTVRVFVQPATFGYPVPTSTYISRLGQLVAMAAAHGLKVHLNLFDLWHSYTDLTGSQQWAGQILAPFHADPRISVVELQNEIDPTNTTAMAWASAMLPIIRSDSGLPVTVSVTGWDTNSATALGQLITGLGTSQPDFYDIHFYGIPPHMLSTFQTAKQIAHGTPLLVGETGYSTDPSNTSWIGAGQSVSTQEQAQAYFYAYVEQAAASAGLPKAASWTLNDFPALANLSATEQHFGLYRLDGTEKPAAAILKRYFTS